MDAAFDDWDGIRHCTSCGCPRDWLVTLCPWCGDSQFSLNPNERSRLWSKGKRRDVPKPIESAPGQRRLFGATP